MNRWVVFVLGMLAGAALFAAGTALVPQHQHLGGHNRPAAQVVII